MKMVLVLGLSGVGKSTLIRRAAECKIFLHLSAGDLIKTGLARRTEQATSEELRKGAVLNNQQILLQEFCLATGDTIHNLVILDGHNLIDTPTGLLDIPNSLLSALEPKSVVYIEDDPSTILTRRLCDAERSRPARRTEELLDHQNRARSNAIVLADGLEIPFRSIRSGDIEAFLSALD